MGLEIRGEVVLRNGQVTMELDIANKAMSPMSQFGIQFNKNSFGLGKSLKKSHDFYSIKLREQLTASDSLITAKSINQVQSALDVQQCSPKNGAT